MSRRHQQCLDDALQNEEENKKSPNNNSNPQQGSHSWPQDIHSKDITSVGKNDVAQIKIPPYKRDSRKLFVGGLPPGGKYVFF